MGRRRLFQIVLLVAFFVQSSTLTAFRTLFTTFSAACLILPEA
jgi:hypothetical protein